MTQDPEARRRRGPLSTRAVMECDVLGPRGETGCLLRAPSNEKLAWDLENEVVSARREWLEEEGGWWVAGSYRDTVINLVLRTFAEVLIVDREAGNRIVSRTDDGELTERAV